MATLESEHKVVIISSLSVLFMLSIISILTKKKHPSSIRRPTKACNDYKDVPKVSSALAVYLFY